MFLFIVIVLPLIMKYSDSLCIYKTQIIILYLWHTQYKIYYIHVYTIFL